MKKNVCAILCALCLLVGTLCTFTSCSFGRDVDVISAEINGKGELVLTYSDGSEQNLGRVVGWDGEDGKDGEDGEDGRDGLDGKDGEDGAPGKDGATGAPGQDGATGAPGKDGAPGQDGAIILEGDGANVSVAIAKGLRSAVSIHAFFTKTTPSYRPGNSGRVEEYVSAGSGVIYQLDRSEGDAFIVTNYHVVYDLNSDTANGISNDIVVYLYGGENEGQEIRATYVGGSLYYDVAVLRVEDNEILKNSDACAVTVADSDQVSVGDGAIAIGNAQGYGIAASAGVVSVDSEYVAMTAVDGVTSVASRFIRVDTAINPGNSGGGLYDAAGNLIGIVDAKIVDEGVENIGYAIPSNVAIAAAENIIDHCWGTALESVRYAVFGATVAATDSRAVYDVATGKIVIKEDVSVYEIASGTLAYGVLKVGDQLISATLNGKTVEITRLHHIFDLMLQARAGDTVTIRILRNGVERTVSLAVTAGSMADY